ncbi:tetratricopeptide repeat protein [Desulforegula conservatrix]|uniref:tetratricopeptide repeat protein n=1 Tax=Desulforegula conservatrix TaxID=153026 RepID=UPI00041E228A|nr:tetratricopeptide repeat protein [Desulforegula conservatrix]
MRLKTLVASIVGSILLLNFFLLSFANAQIDCAKIKNYKDLRKQGGCDGEIHHLIEKRFADIFGVDPDIIPSICLTKEEHRSYTNKWREYIPYGKEYNNLSIQTIIKVFTEIYNDNPCIIKKLLKFLEKNLEKKIGSKLYKKLIQRIPKLFPQNAIEPIIRRIYIIVFWYEVYSFFPQFDENFCSDANVIKAEELFAESQILAQDNKQEAIKKLSGSYFFIGYAVYKKMETYISSPSKEVVNVFTEKKEFYSKWAIELFKKSLELDSNNPYTYLYLGNTYSAIGSKNDAVVNYQKSIHYFKQQGDTKFSEPIEKMIINLK